MAKTTLFEFLCYLVAMIQVSTLPKYRGTNTKQKKH